MDKIDRAELLRARFRVVSRLPYVATGKARPKPVERPKPTKICMAWPEIIPDTKRAPGWLREPDATAPVAPRPKRNQGTSALTKIAAKWRRFT